MHFLSYIEPSMQVYHHFYNHKLAIATAFKHVFGFDLGEDVFVYYPMDVGLEKGTATPTSA